MHDDVRQNMNTYWVFDIKELFLIFLRCDKGIDYVLKFVI